MKEIENNLIELSTCKESIQSKSARSSELLTKLESSKSTLNIDEYFGPVQPLYKQLMNAFVEENSLVDTIFYLNEALQKGVIDLDIFIKVYWTPISSFSSQFHLFSTSESYLEDSL